MSATNGKSITLSSKLQDIDFGTKASVPGWLRQLRCEGRERFNQMGIPSVKDEEWKYTNVTPLAERQFHFPMEFALKEKALLKHYLNPQETNIVLVNGVYSEEFSNVKNLVKGLTVTNLTVQADNAQLKKLINLFPSTYPDVFAALNNALLQEGIFIQIDDATVVQKVIHVVHVANPTNHDTIIVPRTLISIGKSAQVDILESHVGFSSGAYFANALTDILIKENAAAHYCKAQAESKGAYHIGSTRIWQKRDSNLETFSLTVGGTLTRNNLNIILEEPGTTTFLHGLYTMKEEQHVDNHTCVEHRAPNCTSNQLYKGILDQHSRAVFNGKIIVSREAQQTNSYQLNKNLMLGSDCRIDTKPQLEIFADDVKCTHGATIGQLNEDEIFYLKSRNIPQDLAVRILARGFVDDILNRLPNQSICEKLNQLLSSAIDVLK